MVALGCAAAGVALSVLVATGATSRLDRPVSAAAVSAALSHHSLTALAQVLEQVTQPVWVYLAGLLGSIRCWRSGRHRDAIATVVAGAVASVASPAVKALLGRARPALDAGLTTAGGGSFPSGHAFASATVAFAVLVLLLPRARTPRRALLRRVAAGAFLLVVAVDRVWLGAHWPSDVLGGWLFAGAVVAGTAHVVARASERDGSEGDG